MAIPPELYTLWSHRSMPTSSHHPANPPTHQHIHPAAHQHFSSLPVSRQLTYTRVFAPCSHRTAHGAWPVRMRRVSSPRDTPHTFSADFWGARPPSSYSTCAARVARRLRLRRRVQCLTWPSSPPPAQLCRTAQITTTHRSSVRRGPATAITTRARRLCPAPPSPHTATHVRTRCEDGSAARVAARRGHVG